MAFRSPFCKIVFCMMLAVNCMHGNKMRPDEVEELMRAMSTPKVARTLPDEGEKGDDPKMAGI